MRNRFVTNPIKNLENKSDMNFKICQKINEQKTKFQEKESVVRRYRDSGYVSNLNHVRSTMEQFSLQAGTL